MTMRLDYTPVHAGVRAMIGSLTMAAFVAGCHHAPRGGTAPSLTSLSPNRADVSQGQVVDVTVNGAGFDSLNSVSFGDLELRQVPRLSASTLRFTVPLDDVQRPGRGEAPPARLVGGTYSVRVRTSHGTSNVLPFTLVNVVGAR